ncbi:esterase [Streptacidiphilus sp. PB12-B1b]|uniref:alpha/beta hydrolase n=1 Tax=Streptacidiphilus sp. PB12-B1b TaxID=2705012 RepID=UPI0015FC121D|nr:alpha/beta hydrolase-fold protein [Streptacidiphilus sp. PB12-B1b]QMU74903.1 esterase [Streptacidiphilus sp. PB12-B1b]
MGLTSHKLQTLVAVFAVVCFAATVWLWPRLARGGWLALLGRIGMLLASQLLTLAAIGLAANNWGGFYSSWGDLLGTDQGGTATITNGVQPASAQRPGVPGVRVLGSKPVALMLPGSSGGGGTLQKVVIDGSGTRLSEPAYVYLPPQYKDPAYAHHLFPVILVFTGYPGTPENLITRMKYPTIAAQAIHQNQLQPTVLVLMRPSVQMPRDTECQDVPGGPQAETFFTRDLHQAMAARYRVGTAGSGWGVIGDSTGGYCALKLTMRHPEAFAAAASLSGYYKAAEDDTTGNLFGGSQELRNQNDLMWRLKNLPAPSVSVLVASSRKGEFDYKATEQFVAAVKEPMQVSSLILPSGGHNFDTWNRETPQALRWLGAKLHAASAPAPAPAPPAPGPSGSSPSTNGSSTPVIKP